MKRNIENGKAALYTRVSTNYQIDKDSLPHQREELINYANYVLRIDDYEVFEDAGFSGKNTDRPAFQEMMRRIRQGEFTHLVVDKIDRISRNLLDFAAMYEELKALEVVFVSRNEQFDTSNAMGEAMLKIILVFAELERHVTSERVTAIMIDRAHKGKWNGANVPLGYKWSETEQFPVIDENEAKIVKKIYDLYESGDSMKKISIYLNEHKIKTKRNGDWTNATVSQILANPFYKGTLRYNYRNAARGKIKKEEEWVIVDNNHPGIVSAEQWNHVQEISKSRRHGKGGQKQKYDHIFIGIVKCICGSHATGQIQRNRKEPPISRYCCINALFSSKVRCDNSSSISDVMIGNFVFSYLRNMIYIQNNMKRIPDKEKLEKELLFGEYLSDVKYIEEKSLQDIYDSFVHKHDVNYQKKEKKTDMEVDRKTNLEQEREAHKRALERLNKAYLYDDATLTEKEYLTERQNIQDNIRKIDSKIKQMQYTENISQNDEKFIEETNNFLIKNVLSNRGEFNWKEFANNIDKKELNLFLKTIITKITFNGHKILSIEFKNGIVHRFVYK